MSKFTLRVDKGLDNIHDPVQLGKIADYRDPTIGVLVEAENVDIFDTREIRPRVGRAQRLAATDPHSAYAHAPTGAAFFVVGGTLKRLNADYTAATIAVLSSNQALAYEPVNSELVVSNGVDIGWLTYSAFTAFAPALGQFELAMPAGQYLSFDPTDNVLLSAAGSVVYRSKPHNVEVRDTRLSEFPMDGYVRMLAAVEDGWWVATDKHVSFVRYVGEEGLAFQHISDSPPPDGCFRVDRVDTKDSSRREVVWASEDGFCIGRSGGVYENISFDQVRLPTGSSGRLFRREFRGIDQYIAVIREASESNIYTTDDLPITTLTT